MRYLSNLVKRVFRLLWIFSVIARHSYRVFNRAFSIFPVFYPGQTSKVSIFVEFEIFIKCYEIFLHYEHIFAFASRRIELGRCRRMNLLPSLILDFMDEFRAFSHTWRLSVVLHYHNFVFFHIHSMPPSFPSSFKLFRCFLNCPSFSGIVAMSSSENLRWSSNLPLTFILSSTSVLRFDFCLNVPGTNFPNIILGYQGPKISSPHHNFVSSSNYTQYRLSLTGRLVCATISLHILSSLRH